MMITAVVVMAAGMGGCSMADLNQTGKNIFDYINPRNSFLDPSQVGRFDKEKPWGW